jgi:hypothetical protein
VSVRGSTEAYALIENNPKFMGVSSVVLGSRMISCRHHASQIPLRIPAAPLRSSPSRVSPAEELLQSGQPELDRLGVRFGRGG